MNYLLDTHILLWWLSEPEKIGKKAHTIISDKSNRVFASSISFWEMAIKSGYGKLNIPRNMMETLLTEGFELLSLHPKETFSVIDLPPIHRDPFDRMLIAQAKFSDLVLITKDKNILSYPLVTLKA